MNNMNITFYGLSTSMKLLLIYGAPFSNHKHSHFANFLLREFSWFFIHSKSTAKVRNYYTVG